MTSGDATPSAPEGLTARLLGAIERTGNRLPDPAVLFVILLAVVWVLSALLAPIEFAEIDPRSGKPLRVVSQLTGPALAAFLSNMVTTFTGFPPLGVVLVALLGVGVAEHAGFIGALLRALLALTHRALLTPMLLLVAILSHSAADAGYVLVIPLGGVIFHAAGRHPVAGIVAAFAGVSGGFGANFIPSALDPLLQGFTQSAAQIMDPLRVVNPLCNWFFAAASSLLVVVIGWWITERVVEPRLRTIEVDGDPAGMPPMTTLDGAAKRGLVAGLTTMIVGLLALLWLSLPATSPLRAPDGSLTAHAAPLMRSIVPLIFLLFLLPGIVYGAVAGTIRSHRDVVQGMSKSMGTMGYYLVLAFCAAQFTAAFGLSNLGALVALKGAGVLQSLSVPGPVTIVGIIFITAFINLFIGSASAKWALLAPMFVPMLMRLGISPELTQAAYRVGDSTTNIVTPLMPYFPLVVVYAQRYVRKAGIGTLISLMLPYTVSLLTMWILFLLGYWALGLPLGIQATYTVP